MASVALTHLTALLQARKLDGTLTRQLSHAVPATSTGVDAFDEALVGGWPRGQVSEVVGPQSSGRTSLVMATLAAVTARGGVVAWVDVSDRLDPLSAVTAGVDLDRLLWVRGPSLTWGSPHSTVGDLAVRRGLRAFDLIARAGGFAVIVLDFADVPERAVRSLPASTWLRLAHVHEGRDTVGLLVGTAPIGRSAGGVSVSLHGSEQWTGTSAQSRRLVGLSVQPDEVRRARVHRDSIRRAREKAGQACFFAS